MSASLHVSLLAGAALLAGLACAAATPLRVQVPSLDAPASSAVVLPGHWFAAEASAAAPAMLLAERDDWTLAAPCKALAERSRGGPTPQWESYADAYHGFDGTAPLRLRRNVPGGANPGHGVHVGGESAARAVAAQRLEQFLKDTWSLKP